MQVQIWVLISFLESKIIDPIVQNSIPNINTKYYSR